MPRYIVRYFDRSRDVVVQQDCTAASVAGVRAQLGSAGHAVLSVRGAPFAAAARWSGEALDVSAWCRELHTLVAAGMTVVEALETLQLQRTGRRHRPVNGALLNALRQGQSLSRAMAATGAFPQVLVAGVAASERTSTLPGSLQDYLRYDDLMRRLKRQVASASIYPAMVSVLGAAVSLFLLLFVLPRFAGVYGDHLASLSLPTRALLVASSALRAHAAWLAGAVVLAVAAMVWAWRAGYTAAAAGRLVDLIGPLRRGRQAFRHAQLYQSMALMFRGGYTLDDALAVCAGLGQGPAMSESVEGARAQLARGRPVSTALSESGLADEVSERLLAVGERSGGFETVLQAIADRHAEQFATFVARLTRVVEPVLLLAVALAVGMIVVMMYMPVFDIAGGIR